MIAVTISTPSYFDLANQQAEFFRRNSGLDTIVIHASRDEDGYEKKLTLPSIFPNQTVVFFDADYRLVRETNFSEFQNKREFFGVFDGGVHCPRAFLMPDVAALNLDGSKYINTGFWVANFRRAEHVQAFSNARQIMAEKKNGLHGSVQDKTEQSILNAGLQRAGVQIKHLHPRYNFYFYALDHGFIPWIPSKIIGLHAAGVIGPKLKAEMLDAQQSVLCSQPSSRANRKPLPGAIESHQQWIDGVD